MTDVSRMDAKRVIVAVAMTLVLTIAASAAGKTVSELKEQTHENSDSDTGFSGNRGDSPSSERNM